MARGAATSNASESARKLAKIIRMISPEEYADAIRGNSPEMALVVLETRFRAQLESKLESVDNNYGYNACVIEYMNHTLAAARALGLDLLNAWEVPPHTSNNSYADRFHDFTTAIDGFKVEIQIASARSRIYYSVSLDSSEKDKIRHFVQQIKTVVESSHLTPKRKDRLFDLINDFLAEVERERTGWDRFSELVIGIAHLGGEAAQELEPARKFIDSIARLLGRAKEFEDSALQIPPPSIPRQISPPKDTLPSPPKSSRDNLDDEIPF